MIVLSGAAAVYSAFAKGLGADAAAWVQAAGSIAAISGAVWLWIAEKKEARRSRRLNREEAAWSVRYSIVQAQHEVNTVLGSLIHPSVWSEIKPTRDWHLQLQNAKVVLKRHVDSSDFFTPALIHFASNAILLLDHFEEDLLETWKCAEPNKAIVADDIPHLIRYVYRFGDIVETFDSVLTGVSEALNRGDDYLPLSEFVAWSAEPTRQP